MESEGCWHRRLRNIYWTHRWMADGRKDGWTESEVQFGRNAVSFPLRLKVTQLDALSASPSSFILDTKQGLASAGRTEQERLRVAGEMELTLHYVLHLQSQRAFTDVFSFTIRSHPPRMKELPELSRWKHGDSERESQAPSLKPYTYKVAGAGLQPKLLQLWDGDHLSMSAFLSLDLMQPL